MQVVVGIDIGGTKCAISFAKMQEKGIVFLDKIKMKTETEDFNRAVESFIKAIRTKFRRTSRMASYFYWDFLWRTFRCGKRNDFSTT